MVVEWPFVGTEALAAGVVNRYQLATRYEALFRNVYVPKGLNGNAGRQGDRRVAVVGPTRDRRRPFRRCTTRISVDRRRIAR